MEAKHSKSQRCCNHWCLDISLIQSRELASKSYISRYHVTSSSVTSHFGLRSVWKAFTNPQSSTLNRKICSFLSQHPRTSQHPHNTLHGASDCCEQLFAFDSGPCSAKNCFWEIYPGSRCSTLDSPGAHLDGFQFPSGFWGLGLVDPQDFPKGDFLSCHSVIDKKKKLSPN